jgi:hypothetical protein
MGEMNLPVEVPEDQAGPKSAPETPEILQRLVKHCTDLRSKFEESDYRKKKLKEIAASHRTYEQEPDPKDKDWPFENAENIILPMTTITVDNMEPRLVAGLIGKEPIVNLEMDGMEEQDEPTEVIEDWFNKELKNKVKIKPSVVNMVHTMLLEGTVYQIPGYDIKDVKKRRPCVDQNSRQPVIGDDGKPVTEEYMETVFEGGTIEQIPFEDVLVADNIGTMEEWEECDKIRIVRPTYAALQRLAKANAPGYANIGPYLLSGKVEDREMTTAQTIDGVKITGREVIECIECHITYPVNQDETKEEDEQTDFEEEKIIVTIATKTDTIIRMIKQNQILGQNEALIKRIRMFPEWGKSFGTSIYEKLKNIQRGGSDIFNMTLNVAYLVMMPWFFYDSKSGLRGEKTLKPGKGLAVDDVNGIKIPEFRINPSQYLEFMNIFNSLWERVGSIGDWQLGRTNEAGGRKTATEVMSVIQEGNIKHNYQAEVTKDEFITVVQCLYDFYYEKMSPQKTFIFKGKQVMIPREAMQRGFRFVLQASTESANKYIDRREKEDLMNMLGQDAYINPIKPREEVLKAYGIQDTETWINPNAKALVDLVAANPEVMQVVGQYMQEKSAVQAALGGGNANKGTPGVGGVSAASSAGTGAGRGNRERAVESERQP